MSSGLITTYLGQGLAAARPPTPDLPTGAIGFYWATDGSAGFELQVYANGSWNIAASLAAAAPRLMPIDLVAGTTYTFASADSYRHKRFTNAAGCTATVPTNASDPIPIGTRIRCTATIAHPAGQVILAPAGGVTLNSADGQLKSRVQFSVFEIEKVNTNEWDVLGDVSA
jgi:hypothetical protein